MAHARDLQSMVDLVGESCRRSGDDLLRLGDAAPWLIHALATRGETIRTATGQWASVQLDRRHGVVVAQPSGDQAAAIVHCAVQHVVPGGLVVLCDVDGDSATDAMAARFDLEPVARFAGEDVACTAYRRTERFTIHDLVHEARSTIRRISAQDLAAALDGPSPPTVVDTRTHTDRQRYRVIDGSIHAPRTVVEWHLDPANGYRHPAISNLDQPIVIVCNGGYSSSLAAANLVRLGFTDVADLVGGMHAWTAAGLPTCEPDHSHLDL